MSGLTAGGKLPIDGPTVSFELHLNAGNSVEGYGDIANSFRIYSPNGALWSGSVGDTVITGWSSWFDNFAVVTFSADGALADTVGFGGAVLSVGTGLPSGFNEVAWRLTIGPIDRAFAGDTICIDSAWFPPSGRWLWQEQGGTLFTPEPFWDGPHCFEIEAVTHWFVSPTEGSAGGSGTITDPLLTLQQAVDSAGSDDTIFLLPGTYAGPGNVELINDDTTLRVVGVYGADSTSIGDGTGAEFLASSTELDSLNLLGLAFGGVHVDSRDYALTVDSCRFVQNAGLSVGGFSLIRWCVWTGSDTAVVVYHDSAAGAEFHDCGFFDNQTAVAGSGLDTVLFDSCLFIANDTVHSGGIDGGLAVFDDCTIDSSGLFIFDSRAVLRRSNISNCQTAFDLRGSHAIVEADSSTFSHCGKVFGLESAGALSMTGCTLDSNAVVGFVPNDSLLHDCSLALSSCTIADNDSGLTIGAGASCTILSSVYARNGAPLDITVRTTDDLVSGCTFVGNTGGALRLVSTPDDSVLAERCLIAFNGTFGVEVTGTDSGIYCCNIFANEIDYSGFLNQTGSFGNISLPPRLCDTAAGDYLLAANSPCLAANNACSTLIGARDTGCGPLPVAWHVDTTGSDPFGNGTTSAPFASIGHAVGLALDGDSVLIHPGLYAGPGNTNIAVGDRSLVISSTGGSDSTLIDNTGTIVPAFRFGPGGAPGSVLADLTFDGTTGRPVVVCSSAVVLFDACEFVSPFGIESRDADLTLRHCFFENGFDAVRIFHSLTTIDSCRFENNFGALRFTGGTSNIRDCDFVGNYMEFQKANRPRTKNNREIDFDFGGAAIQLLQGASATIRSSNFINNTVVDYFAGGAIAADSSSLVLDSCVLTGNGAFVTFDGSGIGGAVMARSTRIDVADCHFADNGASVAGGAIFAFGGDSLLITASVFDSNEVGRNNLGSGGAIACDDSVVVVITGSRLSDNIAHEKGGAIYHSHGSLAIDSCLLARNVVQGSDFFFGGAGTSLAAESSSVSISRSTVYGGFVDVLLLEYDTLQMAAVQTAGSELTLDRTIIAFNRGGLGLLHTDTTRPPTISETAIYANTSGDWTGAWAALLDSNCNLAADPLFCDTAAGSFNLYEISPCAPATNPCGNLIGLSAVACTAAVVDSIRVDSIGDNQHVLSPIPVIYWLRRAGVQTEFEIAVGVDNNWAFAEMWNPAPLLSADTFVVYNGSPLLDGALYYLRLRVSYGAFQSDWYESTFRTNSMPGPPDTLAPHYGYPTGSTVSIWILNGVDPDGDMLIYEIDGFHDTDCVDAPPLQRTGIPEGVDSTEAVFDLSDGENCLYCWRARSSDGFEFSDWSALSCFYVNGLSESPDAPQLVTPTNLPYETLYDMRPVFRWTSVEDPDPFDSVYYRFQLSTDHNFTFVLTADSLALPEYQPTDSLAFSDRYWWRTYAIDTGGLAELSLVDSFWTWTLADVNHDHDLDVSDLVYMVEYSFNTPPGPPIDPVFVGDVDGNCFVDVADIVYLVEYQFGTGPAPLIGCQ